eukprot:scaffold291522_cov40-Prasinocladus_malaysianus.AAC.2
MINLRVRVLKIVSRAAGGRYATRTARSPIRHTSTSTRRNRRTDDGKPARQRTGAGRRLCGGLLSTGTSTSSR